MKTNDGALKLSGQAGVMFAHLAGVRDNYKNGLLVQGKQTVQCIMFGRLKKHEAEAEGSTVNPIMPSIVLKGIFSALCSIWSELSLKSQRKVI